jgi:hypothetical protein
MKRFEMTREQAEAHQRKHGFSFYENLMGIECGESPVPRPRMNRTETEYSLILEAMKRRGEIVEWRFEGIALSWGIDPETKKPMWYTPDFMVMEEIKEIIYPGAVQELPRCMILTAIKLIEVKGAHIRSRDLVRFKGCRADWPMFRFEMWQKKGGQWNRIH